MPGLVANIRFFCQHGRLPLRDRYWKRGDGRLRVRYALAGYCSASALFSFAALSFFPVLAEQAERGSVRIAALMPKFETILSPSTQAPERPPVFPVLAAAPSLAGISPSEKIIGVPATPLTMDRANTETKDISDILASYRGPDGQIRRQADVRNLNAMVRESNEQRAPHNTRLTIAAGDTLSGLLIQAGLDPDETNRAITALRKHVKPSDLRPGQTLDLELLPDGGAFQFNRLALSVDPVRTVEVRRGFAGFYNTKIKEKPLKRDIAADVAIIKASLYGSASAAGIPNAVTAEAIRAFSHQIDFQRDLHPGDRLEIMYDRFVTDDGYIAKSGGMIYAKLMAGGRELSVYRFEDRHGRVDYFDRSGKSIRKALLRTPMDGARVTSGFGMRRHPLLGYSKMHKGVDFGASSGTPIYAAGDGIIEKAGRFSSYGNYIRIRHNNSLSTAYAHMSHFGQGIRPGTRVRQGQIIGYVGTTGRSTGPHLHYEVMVNGAQMNPQSVKLPTMVALDGQDLHAFKAMVRKLDQDFKNKTDGVRMALASSDETSNLLMR